MVIAVIDDSITVVASGLPINSEASYMRFLIFILILDAEEKLPHFAFPNSTSFANCFFFCWFQQSSQYLPLSPASYDCSSLLVRFQCDFFLWWKASVILEHFSSPFLPPHPPWGVSDLKWVRYSPNLSSLWSLQRNSHLLSLLSALFYLCPTCLREMVNSTGCSGCVCASPPLGYYFLTNGERKLVSHLSTLALALSLSSWGYWALLLVACWLGDGWTTCFSRGKIFPQASVAFKDTLLWPWTWTELRLFSAWFFECCKS